jgi:MFS family permease
MKQINSFVESHMALRIIINDKECTSPIVKYGLAIAVLIGTIAISALIVFVLLPIIGVSIAATLGLLIVIAVGIFAAAVALTLGSAILSALIVFVDYLADKFGRR